MILSVTDVTQRGNVQSICVQLRPFYQIERRRAEKSGQARHCQPAHCHITHHLRFYVASLRRCVRLSFAFRNAACHSMG